MISLSILYHSQIQRLGYTSGYEESQFPLKYDLTRTDEKREKPVIEDIRYAIDDAFSKKHKWVFISYSETKKITSNEKTRNW